MSGRRLAIFDIGSTLVDGPAEGPAAQIARGLGLDERLYAQLATGLMTMQLTSPDAVSVMVRTLAGEGPVERVVEDVWRAQECATEPIEGAAEAMADLARNGFDLALVSNIWQPYVTSVRRHFGAFFDRHIRPELQLFSYRAGSAKPSPRMLQDALRLAGVAAEDAVMVGDSYLTDIEPAAGLGMKTVWVLHRPQKEARDVVRVLDGSAPQPSRTLGSIAELGFATASSAWAASAT
jgi:HAD superfamily hydrolase (TIGR01509 family)